jgi:hypothetical protein
MFLLKEKLNQILWFRSVISAIRRQRQEDCEFKDSLAYKVRFCLKNQELGCISVVEGLPSMPNALNSIPRTVQKRKS